MMFNPSLYNPAPDPPFQQPPPPQQQQQEDQQRPPTMGYQEEPQQEQLPLQCFIQGEIKSRKKCVFGWLYDYLKG